MRWRSIASEAWRNITSGAALTVPLCAVLGALAAALTGLGSFETLALTAHAERFHDAGAAILILQAPGAVDGRACEALNGTPGVRSGALRAAPGNVVGAALPDSSVPTYEVTSGLPGLLGAEPRRAGVLLSPEVARTLGDGLVGVEVAGVYGYPDDGRRADLGYAVLVPTLASGAFDECWAETWPPSRELESLLRTSYAPRASGTDLRILQLNGTLGETFDGAAQFAARTTRWLPLLGAAAAFVIAFSAMRLRRVELASARHAGVRLADQLAIALGECLAWVAATIALVTPVVCAALLHAPRTDAPAHVHAALLTTALAVAAGVAGSALAVLLSGERHLFRLVKQRR